MKPIYLILNNTYLLNEKQILSLFSHAACIICKLVTLMCLLFSVAQLNLGIEPDEITDVQPISKEETAGRHR